MAKNDLINVECFGEKIGRVGFDEQANKSYFQYYPDYLQSGKYQNLFPETGIIKRIPQPQVFTRFNNETFRGLPPQIADSLPDMFGNFIFNLWLQNTRKTIKNVSVIEQLAYVANRGMGALEYHPTQEISRNTSIDLKEIIEVLKQVLNNKQGIQSQKLNSETLLNIFKIGTSAGGARPKILISEHKQTGQIIPGDLEYSEDYHHYLVKLSIDENENYGREIIEYCYYLTATELGIAMMPSKLIDNKHFCTERFDRQNGAKKHILTATGLTAWDFKNPEVSSYENLFQLALFLKIPHEEVEELYQRMVFNVLFFNTDDHLKNHSFIYDEIRNEWHLSPAYDLTYALNPLLDFKKTSRALSINGKRTDITIADLLQIAESFTIKNAKNIITKMRDGIKIWHRNSLNLGLSENIIKRIVAKFSLLA